MMSTVLCESARHSEGFWMDSAREFSRCLECFLDFFCTYNPRPSWDDQLEMEWLFKEIEQAIAGGSAHRATYQLAKRALQSAYENPLYPLEFLSPKEPADDLCCLAVRFKSLVNGQTSFSEKEFDELILLTSFFRRLAEESERECYEGVVAFDGLDRATKLSRYVAH